MEQLVVFLLYIICSLIAGFKQLQIKNKVFAGNVNNGIVLTAMAFILGPIWLAIAIIRQVLLEEWH